MRWQSIVVLMALASSCCAGIVAAQTEGNPIKGKRLFQDRCAECHAISMDGSAQGPNLSSVIGRRSAAVVGFNYTKGLRKAKLTWNEATLNKYLADPGALVPGTAMQLRVTDAEERKDLIAFLRTRVGPAIQPAHTNNPTPPSTFDSNR